MEGEAKQRRPICLSLGTHQIRRRHGALVGATDGSRPGDCGGVGLAARHSQGNAGTRSQRCAEAKRILLRTNFPLEKLPAVVDAIARHVGLYRAAGAPALSPIETAVLWDADKLTKLGVQALAYGLSMSYMRGLTLPQRRSNMLEFTQSVLIRTVESMNTLPARQEAAQRYQVMLEMLEAWRREQELDEDQNEVSPDNTGLPEEQGR